MENDSDDPSGKRWPRRGWQIRILRGIPRVHIPYRLIEASLRRVGRGCGARGEVTVIIADDKIMRRLNRRFRNKDRATDVLAFPLNDDTDRKRVEGEVYICHDHARRWQQAEGGTIAGELTRLAVHGCLHLLGYRHNTAATRRRMAEAEDRYLQAAGLIAARAGQGRHDG
jgi:rRNA maturation RNase YbeY